MNFKELQIIEPILRGLEEANYKLPTPIQEKAIPPVLAGRDLVGCAQTGTGKTAAFAIPILQILSQNKPTIRGSIPIRSLVISPTRELALQIYESLRIYGRHLNLRSGIVFGGVAQGPQIEALRRGVDILVATPGRLLDLVNQKHIDLKNVEIFVLDEADRMLDMGFIHDVRKITGLLPVKKQTLLFSATMPQEIIKIIESVLDKPEYVEVTPISSTVDAIEQYIYFVEKPQKPGLLVYLLQNPELMSVLVFTRTKHGADRVARSIKAKGIPSAAIHGNKSQGARQSALQDFKTGVIRVLVATDIAARGLDIEELSHVINYDLPNIPETYVHRIGRTGRAGADGIAISFCASEEQAYLKDIEKLIGKRIQVITEQPFATDMTKMTKHIPFELTETPRLKSELRQRRPSGTRNPKPTKVVEQQKVKAIAQPLLEAKKPLHEAKKPLLEVKKPLLETKKPLPEKSKGEQSKTFNAVTRPKSSIEVESRMKPYWLKGSQRGR